MGSKYQANPTATLDLHRKTIAEAEILLNDFFETAQENKHQQVLVITGKGLHSPSGAPTLRPFVKDWLFRHSYNFRPAKLNQGGDGALLIRIL